MYKAEYRLEYDDVRQMLAETDGLPKYKLRCTIQTILGALGAAIFFDSARHDPGYLPNYLFLVVCVVLAFVGWIKAYFDTERAVQALLTDTPYQVEIDDEWLSLSYDGETERYPLDGSHNCMILQDSIVFYLPYGKRHIIPLRAFGESADDVRKVFENGCCVRNNQNG